MNLNTLEKLVRQSLKGGNLVKKSNEMLSGGYITPAEHRSLKSLSSQIAANVRATPEYALAGGRGGIIVGRIWY